MYYKFFRIFFVLILIIGLTAIPAPQSVRAAGPWYVSTTGDDGNDCLSQVTPCATINGAIGKSSAGDIIKAATGNYTGTDNEVVLIDRDITLSGGWDDTFTTQSGMSTVDGQEVRRGITVASSLTAAIELFTIQNSGGDSGDGNGIYNSGILTLNKVYAHSNGRGVLNNGGTLTINNSAFTNNGGIDTCGGGIFNSTGILTINNSTISDNASSPIYCAPISGLANFDGTAALNNVTISNNINGSIRSYPANVTTLQNSLIAGNKLSNGESADCYAGEVLNSLGYNLFGAALCTFNSATGDQIGTQGLPIDPQLGLLIGSPAYYPLASNSPAIDAGNPNGCEGNSGLLTTDQRGAARVSICDIGAYEYTTPGPAASLSIISGSGQQTGTSIAFPQPLQAAALDSQGSPVSGVTIDFTAPASGPSGTFADTGNNVTSAITDAGGVAATSTFTANNEEGTYSVTASASGLGSVEFSLEQIARPSNDDLANAEVISLLPFNGSVNSTQATMEPGESSFCGSTPQTQSVWYSFTPAANVAVIADMAGSSFSDTNLTVFQSVGSGFEGLNFMNTGCFGGSITFNAQAGTTYYLQAQSYSSGGGDLHLNLQEIPRPVNDDFANAKVIPVSLPFDDNVDTLYASLETGEPTPSCAYYGSAYRSVWYAITPTTSSLVSAGIPSAAFTPVLAAYTGDSLASLTEVGCQTYSGNLLTVNMNAGTTYYFQVGNLYPWEQGGSMQFHLDVVPPPSAGMYYYPYSPSSFDTIQFYDQSYDPAQLGFQSFTWDFGDGATSTDSYTTHKYAADGDYTLQHSATTTDGRTASTSQLIQVRTHDVSLTKVEAPESTRVGKSEKITVSVLNTSAYAESVRVDLYRSVAGGGFEYVGTLTKNSASNPKGDKPTKFTFNYTFVDGDAAIGKVIFRAVATIETIENFSDAFPQDNERLSSLTIVKPKK